MNKSKEKTQPRLIGSVGGFFGLFGLVPEADCHKQASRGAKKPKTSEPAAGAGKNEPTYPVRESAVVTISNY